jgi:hypothetical protein
MPVFLFHKILASIGSRSSNWILKLMQDQNKNILKTFADQYNINWKLLMAILMKESNQQGFDNHGNLKSRLERHILSGFRDVLLDIKKKHPSLPGLKADWIKKHTAEELNLMSTSWGMAQIMGYWYFILNHASVKEMIDAWQASEEIQIRDFCLFCVKYNDGRFLDALQKGNFQSIAMQYNGKGYAQNNYDRDLQIYMQKQK